MKKIALTGATSTLGTAIIRECVKQNIEVIAFTNRGSANEGRIPCDPLVTKVYCSLGEMCEFDVIDLTADAFIHLAWGHTNRAVRNECAPQVDNIRYSLDSVKLAEKLGCSVYVGAGSQAEYGRSDKPLTEDAPTHPNTAYGIAKLCSGQMTRLACAQAGIRHIWPRIVSTYGPNTQDTTIINYTIFSLLRGERPSLTGCDQIWDFLYVDDAARALLLLAEKGRDGETYLVASGQSRTMREYIDMVDREMGSPVTIGYGDIPYTNDTVMHLEADITKLQSETGFAPEISFEDGIKKTIEWARKYYG